MVIKNLLFPILPKIFNAFLPSLYGRYNSGYAAGRYHTLLELSKSGGQTQLKTASDTLRQEGMTNLPMENRSSGNEKSVCITWGREELKGVVQNDMEEGEI